MGVGGEVNICFFKKLFVCEILRLYTEYWSYTVTGTGHKVCERCDECGGYGGVVVGCGGVGVIKPIILFSSSWTKVNYIFNSCVFYRALI